MLVAETAADLMNLARLGGIKSARSDESVDGGRAQTADLCRTPSTVEQAQRCRQRDLVPRPRRDDTGEQLFERRVETVRGSLKHRCLGEWLDRLLDPAQG
jgi:hypothetical protein